MTYRELGHSTYDLKKVSRLYFLCSTHCGVSHNEATEQTSDGRRRRFDAMKYFESAGSRITVVRQSEFMIQTNHAAWPMISSYKDGRPLPDAAPQQCDYTAMPCTLPTYSERQAAITAPLPSPLLVI